MNENKVSKRLIVISFSIILIGFIIFIASIVVFKYERTLDLNSQLDSQYLSHLGDVVGGLVGAIWGLAGVVLFYVALRSQSDQLRIQTNQLRLQMKETALQREELKLARLEYTRMANAQEKSEKSLEEQSKILHETLTYQAFQTLTVEYLQPNMSQCVRDLWEFARKHKDRILDAYVEKFEEDYPEIQDAKYSSLEESFTLHNKRRYVSQFYYRIQTFIVRGTLPQEIIYTYWSKRDLEIIPKVLIPMEIAVGKIINGKDYNLDMSNSEIMRLYENCPEERI